MPQPPSPPPRKQRVVNFVSPEIADLIFYELRDGRLPKYKNPPAYGTAHPDAVKYPHHKLVLVSPASESEDGWQKWYYARARGTSIPTSDPNGTFTDQDAYNFEIEGDERLTRTYIIPRAQFLGNAAPYSSYTYAAPAEGTADSRFTNFKFREENILRTRDSTIDAYFIVIQRFYYKAEKLRAASESGSARGEEGSETRREADRLAYSIEPGIILQRSSRLTDEELWDNTENRLALRTGVNNTAISSRVGYKETDTSELAEHEPVQSGEPQFNKRVITTDIHGVDAIWASNRKTRATDPAKGSEMSTFLGGGMLDVDISLVADTSLADSGFKVVGSQVSPMGGGDALKTTKTIDAFPILTEERYDSQLDSMITITKSVIVPGSESGSKSACGSVVEIQPVDKWRSIKIQTSVDASVIRTETIPGVFNFRFPPVLEKAYFDWAAAQAWYGTNRAEDYDVALIFHVAESSQQAVRGRTRRVITCNPEGVIEDNPVISFKPQSHTVSFITAASYASKKTVWAKANVRTWQTPLALCRGINITLPPHLSGGIQGVHVDGNWMAEIPKTSPAGMPAAGTLMTIGITTRRLKLGYWEVLINEIFSPGPASSSAFDILTPRSATRDMDGETPA
tara:strand:+ start:2647 stop:4524 length:1878 start_codon:yes stop_codon:yes gene_type:complete